MRVDLFGVVHKALRSRLFDTSVELGRCDFADPSEVRIAVTAYARTAGFLREHHQHEDANVEPLVRACAPAVAAANHAEHEAIDAKLGAIDAAIANMEAAAGAARLVAGRRVLDLYDDFLAFYLAHMRREETEMQAALWEHCTDDELMGARARIQGSMPTPRFAEWLEIMLPAINLDERAAMLGGMKASVPAPAFRAASEIAIRVLGQSGWSAVRTRAQLGDDASESVA